MSRIGWKAWVTFTMLITTAMSEKTDRPRRLLSYNLPSFNIGFNADGLVTITTTPELFRIVSPGLMGIRSTVSFESVRYPGRYLRHRGWVLHLDTFTEGNNLLFRKDATFYPRHGKYFDGYTAYESYNAPNRFIHHQDLRLRVSPLPNPLTDVFKKEASFMESEDTLSITRTAPTEFISANFPLMSIGFTTSNLPQIATSPSLERFRVVSPGLNGQCGTVSLESERYPGHYLRHRGFLIHLDAFQEKNIFFHDASFWMREGILTQGYVSFESYNFPNRYIRHQGYRLKLHAYDGSLLFKADASFMRNSDSITFRREGPYHFFSKNAGHKIIGLDNAGLPYIVDSREDKFHIVRPGLTGEPGTISLASALYPGHYLRHRNLLMHLDPFEETSLYKPDATFYLRPNHFFQGYFTLESTNMKNYFVRHQYHRMKLHRYDATELFRLDSSYKLEI